MSMMKFALCLVMSGLATTSGAIAEDGTQTETTPYIKLWDDQGYCDGSPVFQIIYDEEFREEKLNTAILSANEDEKMVLLAYLQRLEVIESTIFCVDSSMIDKARVIITYGASRCMPARWGFRLEGLEGVLENGRADMELIDYGGD